MTAFWIKWNANPFPECALVVTASKQIAIEVANWGKDSYIA